MPSGRMCATKRPDEISGGQMSQQGRSIPSCPTSLVSTQTRMPASKMAGGQASAAGQRGMGGSHTRQVVWPTVEQQLILVHIAPGSALEQLVRENQNFHLLRPEE